MLKKTFITTATLAAILISINIVDAKADDSIDSTYMRVMYAFTQKNFTQESLSSRTDTMALDIGYKLSEFYDMTASAKDSLKYLLFSSERLKSISVITKQETAEKVLNTNKSLRINTINPNSYITFTTYKDRDKKNIYTIDKTYDLPAKSVFLIEEINPQQWEIESDTCRIMNYLCHKATTQFRGRKYEVYFAPEIPVNEGPWKLYGLPGVILAAKTTDGYFSFQAIGIQVLHDKSINIPDGMDSEICKNLKQYHQFVQSKAKKEQYLFENNGDITIVEKFSSRKVILMETE